MVLQIQPSFSRGEVGVGLYARVDTQQYYAGLARAVNVVILRGGGVANRPGTTYLAPCGQHDAPPRLIPFQYKTEDHLELEFGHEYLRFIRNDGHVTHLSETITGATQTNPVVLTVGSTSAYSDGMEVEVTGVEGMTDLNNERFLVTVVSGTELSLSWQYDGSPVDGTSFGSYVSGGEVAAIYQIPTPYQQADLRRIKYEQTADVMTLVHPSYPPKKLSRLAIDNWVLEDVVTEPNIAAPLNLRLTSGASGGTENVAYIVTATDRDSGEESRLALGQQVNSTISGISNANPAVVTLTGDQGFQTDDEIFITGVVGMTEVNNRRFTVERLTATTIALLGEDSTGYGAYVSGGSYRKTRVGTTVGQFPIRIAWGSVPNAIRYTVYRWENGAAGFLSSTSGTQYEDEGTIRADVSDAPPVFINPFEDPDQWPGAVGFHEQRKVYGGSYGTPDTSEYSRTGAYDSFSRSPTLRADDAFSVTLPARQVNEIRHYVSLSDLVVLTSGSYWRVGSSGAGFSLATITQKPQDDIGSSHIRPITAQGTVVMVSEQEREVYSLGYSFEVDGFRSNNLTLWSPHLLQENRLLEWAYIPWPESYIVGVHDGGGAYTLTYDTSQQVIGWARWETSGDFESVAVSRPLQEYRGEEVFFVTRRRIKGQNRRYIERTRSRLFSDVRDCFFVDCGLSYDNPVPIEDITFTDPLVFTVTGHGFTDGDVVEVSGIEWEPVLDAAGNNVTPDPLNRLQFVVSNATTDTFEVRREDDPLGPEVSGLDLPVWEGGGVVRLATDEVRGLRHLAGREVVALCDGDVVRNLTVSDDGRVQFPRKYARIHCGLPYISDITTLRVEGEPTVQGLRKRVAKVTVRFQQSRGLLYGPDGNTWYEIKQREFEPMGEPTGLLSGDKTFATNSDWGTEGQVYLRQKDPLPLTVLAVMPDFEVGG